MTELVRVALVDTEPEAQLAVSLLEMEGIPAMWKASDMATTRLFGVGASGIMGPIAILAADIDVPEQALEDASCAGTRTKAQERCEVPAKTHLGCVGRIAPGHKTVGHCLRPPLPVDVVSSVGRFDSSIRSERPVPRRSKTTTRAKDPGRRKPRANGSARHMYSTLEANPGTYTRSNGPSPKA